mgnify:CR=1 FL=1
MTTIGERLRLIKKRIHEAAERAGRNPEDITIVAVSKNVDEEGIAEAVRAGVSVLGENRVQEAAAKFSNLGNTIDGKEINWHLVGHLQRNKVRHALPIFQLIHSLDSWKLAQEIQKVAERLDVTADCLLEINVTGKASRIGVEPENALALARDISALDRIRLRGVMSIAPIVDDPSEARPYFRLTREMWERMGDAGLFYPGKAHLSTGMTHDFEIAVEEGATMVRIGTGIFGPREILARDRKAVLEA